METNINLAEPIFDPNAFGMASLLGGLLVLGLAEDVMIEEEGADTTSNDNYTKVVGLYLAYFGLFLLVCSAVSFAYAFIRHLCHRSANRLVECRPLISERNSLKGRSYGGGNTATV